MAEPQHGLRGRDQEGYEALRSAKVPDAFNENVSFTTAINIPFPQAIPKRAAINAEHCIRLQKGKCGVCQKICPADAIDYTMQDEVVTEKVGAIIAATALAAMARS